MEKVVTADLSRFGYREIKEAIELLTAFLDQKTDLDTSDNLILNMNTNSGYVFLSDEDLNVFMINPETKQLEQFFSCGVCGNEGFNTDYPFKDFGGHCSKKCFEDD